MFGFIFINGFKKVYFILMFDIVSSSKTTESTLCFIEIDFNIFAVCYAELYKNGVPSIVPLGSCWMPVKKQRTSTHVNYLLQK